MQKKQKSKYNLVYLTRKSLLLMSQCSPYYVALWILQTVSEAVFVYYFIYSSAQMLDIIVSGSVKSVFDWVFLSQIVLLGLLAILDRLGKAQFSIIDQHFKNRFPLFVETIIASHRIGLDSAQLDDPSISNLSLKAQESRNRIPDHIETMNYALQNMFKVISALIVLLPYSLWVSVGYIIMALPEFYISSRLQKQKYQIHDSTAPQRKRFHMERSFIQFVQQIREIKMNNAGSYLVASSNTIMEKIYQLYDVREIEKSRFRMVYGSMNALFGLFVLGVLLNDVLAGFITVGYFTLLNMQRFNLGTGLNVFMYNYNRMQSNTMYLQDLFTFLELSPELIDGKTKLGNTPIQSIIFNDVSFAYPGSDREVLQSISFSIPRGSKVAIVGQNGAGKSTFTKLLLRFYDPTTGSISVNGKNLSEYNRTDYYNHISYMAQDYNKYPFSIREAILMSQPESEFDQDTYDRALHISQVDAIIAKLELGDATPLSPQFPGGIEPSIGQWQKIAIARTLYKKADMLILDEPTSAIDAIAELHIFNEIEKLPDDITVFLISHRFNTVKNADVILIIEHGTILESGTHSELLALSGRYAEMYNAQKDSYE
jgi:ATP-binding cassette subfamily B protein